jgi:N-ATPase, AtpR subunit
MTLASLLLRSAIFAVVGIVLGGAYFTALHANTQLYLRGASRRTWAFGLHAFRVAALVAAWLAVARFGGVALVAAFAGLLLARRLITARIGRAA